MSVRYTAEAIMDGPALRDVDRAGGTGGNVASVERWREKIEVRLDNRQVFFLFFGSALVACMLFVLGVMVGKRIESRGQADAPVMADPLAALDRARQPPPGVAAPDQPLTFQSTLVSGAGGPKGRGSAHTQVPASSPKPLVARSAPAVPKPVAAAKPPAPPAAPKPVAAVKPPAPTVDAAKGKGRFTLHLSTFASANEAEAFAQKYPGAFVVSGDVPGKGMAFRVRYGNYSSFKDAAAAKDSFEKQHNTIALVAAR
jgi:cell division septation protein DedD